MSRAQARPNSSFIFFTLSDRSLVSLVRDAIDTGMVARPRVLPPESPTFLDYLVFSRLVRTSCSHPSTLPLL